MIRDTLKRIQHEVHQNAINKGWYDDGLVKSPGEIIALIHSEISEAYEALIEYPQTPSIHIINGKPEGYIVELADAVLRVLDYTSYLKYDYQIVSPDEGLVGFLLPAHCYLSKSLEHFRNNNESAAINALWQFVELTVLETQDLEEAILIKMEYNKTRPHRHGGKAL